MHLLPLPPRSSTPFRLTSTIARELGRNLSIDAKLIAYNSLFVKRPSFKHFLPIMCCATTPPPPKPLTYVLPPYFYIFLDNAFSSEFSFVRRPLLPGGGAAILRFSSFSIVSRLYFYCPARADGRGTLKCIFPRKEIRVLTSCKLILGRWRLGVRHQMGKRLITARIRSLLEQKIFTSNVFNRSSPIQLFLYGSYADLMGLAKLSHTVSFVIFSVSS
jgi:hypothetical protein